MLKKPTPEIEAEVLAEYDADPSAFGQKVFEEMERKNPGMADLLESFMKIAKEEGREFVLGLLMASVVYRQLEISAEGHIPIVEMRPALQKVGREVFGVGPEEFVNQYGTPYLRNGIIGTKTLANFIGDAVGGGLDYQTVLFSAVFLIRVLEGQIELDMCKSREKVF